MIEFLNLKESNDSCECVFKAHSLQLLPNQFDPYVIYIGNTDFPYLNGVDILNQYGDIINIFTDSGDFEHEGYLRLTNLSYDDVNNIVLKVTLIDDLGTLKVLYSDEIQISSYNACKTTRINFKCKDTDVMQSISVPMWFRYHGRALELSNAYQISTKSTVSYSTSNAKYKVYQTKLISNYTLAKLNDALQLPYVYFDYRRVTLYEAFEVGEPQGDGDFTEVQIMVSLFEGLGNNDITPIFNLISEQNDNLITENSNNIILE